MDFIGVSHDSEEREERGSSSRVSPAVWVGDGEGAGMSDESDVAKVIMGLRPSAMFPIHFSLNVAYACPFRHEGKCSVMYFKGTPESNVSHEINEVFIKGKVAGYKARCPDPAGFPDWAKAPPECPLRFGPVTVEVKK